MARVISDFPQYYTTLYTNMMLYLAQYHTVGDFKKNLLTPQNLKKNKKYFNPLVMVRGPDSNDEKKGK